MLSAGPQLGFILCDIALQCFPQRAALLKSMLNFLKKAIPDPAFADSIRHCKLLYSHYVLHTVYMSLDGR